MNILTQKSGVIFFFVMLSLIAFGYGTKSLYTTTNYKVFFSDDNPELIRFEEYQDTYTKNETIFMLVEPQRGDVFDRSVLQAIEQIEAKAWKTPYSSRVDSITNFRHIRTDGDSLLVEPMFENVSSLSDAQISAKRKVVLSDTRIVNRLIDPQGSVTGVVISLELPEKDKSELTEVVASVRQLKADMEARHPIKIYLTGSTMQNNAFVEVSSSDAKVLMPSMFLLVLVAIGVLLRSAWGVVGTLLVAMFSLISGLGLGGWLGIGFTAPSVVSIYIIFMLAIANSVHILVSVIKDMDEGALRELAVVEAVKKNLRPITLTSLTTAVGFLCLNFSASPPYHDLGNLVAGGVVFAWLYSLTLLPLFLKVVPLRVSPGKLGPSSRIMAGLAEFVIARKRIILTVMVVFSLSTLLVLPKLVINDYFAEWFDESIDFRVDTDKVDQVLPVVYALEFSIPSGIEEGITKSEYLVNLEKFSDWLAEQPEVTHVSTIVPTLKTLSQAMNNNDPAYYLVPKDSDLVSQYLLLYELSLPYGLDLTTQVDIDKSATRVVASMPIVSSSTLLDVEARASRWMADNIPSYMHARGTGPAHMFASLAVTGTHASIRAAIIALVLISFILVFALRSVKLGVVSLIPNLVPAAIAFAAWYFIKGEVGLALATVMSMALGIMVDDTVHFLSKYTSARNQLNYNTEDSIRYAFEHVGRALWITSFVLIVGFTLLAQSDFSSNSEKGILTAITLAAALMIDFLLLPTLLLYIDKRPTVTEA